MYQPKKEYHNIALSFAGNAQLGTKASYLPPQDPDVLRRADYVTKGRRGIFEGYTQMKQMLWITLPALAITFLASVLLVLKSLANSKSPLITKGTGYDSLRVFLRPPLRVSREAPMAYIYARSFRMQLVLLGLGCCLLLLCASAKGVFDAGCTDPLIRSTVAPVEASRVFQWLWVTFNLLTIGTAGLILVVLKREEPRQRAECVYRCLLHLVEQPSIVDTSLEVWRSQALQQSVQYDIEPWRRAAFCLLHIPIFVVTSVPAFGFVTRHAS